MTPEKQQNEPVSIDETGYWEREGNNPVIGALVFLFILGGVYFLLQSLILNGYLLIDMALRKDLPYMGGGYFERLKSLYAFYQKPILLIVMISQFLLFLVPTIWYYRKNHHKNWWADFNLDKFSLIGIITAIIGTLLFIPLAELLSSLFYYLFPALSKWSDLQTPLFETLDGSRLFLLLLVIGLTPAICEEILFRGYLQTVLQRKIKGILLIVITGFLFGLYHQNPTGLIALAAAGMWLGFLAWRFQSLYASMMGHLVYNSTIILIVNKKIAHPFVNAQGGFSLTVTLGSTLLFALLVWLIWKFGGRRVE